MEKNCEIEAYNTGKDIWQIYKIRVDTERNIFEIKVTSGVVMDLKPFKTAFLNNNLKKLRLTDESKKIIIMGVLGTK